MPNKDEDKKKLESLIAGQSCTVNWFENGGAQVFNCNWVYVVFEVAQYGGVERYEGTYSSDEIPQIIELAYSWT